jgi:uncharacterized membrane protein (UPF0127 family)
VSQRARFAIAVALAVSSLVAMAVIVMLALGNDDEPAPATFPFGTTKPARAPFEGLTAGRVALGDDCLDVVIADSPLERSDGLRDRTDTDPYDGMLFVYAADTDLRFTMSGVAEPLAIGWYAADGTPLDRTRMEPCPEGSDAECPTYASEEEYRFALETAPGQLGPGPLGSC